MTCPFCDKDAVWCENKAIYGRNYGESYMCYYCADCDAYVGCHKNTREPLGTMADKETREWRKTVHSLIDTLWQSKKIKRGQLYAVLRHHFGFTVHIGESDVDICKKIIEFIKNRKIVSEAEYEKTN